MKIDQNLRIPSICFSETIWPTEWKIRQQALFNGDTTSSIWMMFPELLDWLTIRLPADQWSWRLPAVSPQVQKSSPMLTHLPGFKTPLFDTVRVQSTSMIS